MSLYSYLDFPDIKYEGPRIEEHFPNIFTTFSQMAAVLTLYFSMILIGPSLMKKYSPFRPKRWLLAYNILQVICNVFLLYLIFDCCGLGIFRVWNHVCDPVSSSVGFDQQVQFKVLRLMYVYYLIKIFDLIDTVFLILMKKQLSFLHLFHHSSMVFSIWVTTSFFREQIGIFFGFMNTLVHAVMYCYYFLSSFGPVAQKYLSWKKHLTSLQMV
ncbi:unnamed protein product [Nezara viridula]|uniref:Elongation of very long chain fatty acids protein n=1 Tax=Nezara viridula TaxID=85310 RepID=A0A9P0HFW5_NEZVI|nr:unnamed protein product [Nezara viridula]